MAKEAIAIVLDVGKSMHNNDCHSVLEEAKKCISMIIQRKIFSESKDEIALILYGTSCTENEFSDENVDDYKNISIVKGLQFASWELLEFVNEITGSNISTDYIGSNALLTAINLLQNATDKKKSLSRRILFITCFDGLFSNDKVDEICEELKKYNIDLNVIGPNALSIEDIKVEPDMSPNEDKSLISPKIENSLSKILREVNGESYSFSDVLPALIYYQKRKKQPFPWNANLEFNKSFAIPITAYVKVTEDKSNAWKQAYAFKPNARIDRRFTYQMNDELQTKLTKDDIIPAYKYGTTLVPYSEEDKKNMNYETGEKGMKVLGFTKAESIQRYHFVGDKTMYVFGRKNDECAGTHLAAFIQALNHIKMVAIVRYVYNVRSAPKIGFLLPKINENCEYLVFVILPFMEDLRHFVFNSFDSDSKNLPTEEQLDAIDELISTMDLTVPLHEDDEEILKPENTVNPYLQRLYQCLEFRALKPEKPLPEIQPHIKTLISPPSDLLKLAEKPVKRIASLFPIKAAIVKQKEAKFNVFSNEKSEEPCRNPSTSNNSAPEEKYIPEHKLFDAVIDKIIEVGSINPIRDFQYLVNNKALPFNDICQQLMDVVLKFLQDSTHLKMYHSKILSICKEFRHASLKESNSVKYNSFMTTLQNVLLECDEELWEKIKNEKIGLISKQELSSSTISLEQAEKFLANPFGSEDKASAVESFEMEDDDDEDLLDQL